MNVKEALQTVGGCAIYVLLLIAAVSIATAFIFGGLVVAKVALPWLFLLSAAAFAVCIIIVLPLAIVRSLRPWAGLAIYIASYLFGITCWFSGLLITWSIWGGWAVFVGLLIAGIGVVPIAVLASLFNAMWANVAFLIVMVVVTFGSRMLGILLASAEGNEY